MYIEKIMLKQKFVGCLVDSAVGDALGSSFEGLGGFKGAYVEELAEKLWCIERR